MNHFAYRVIRNSNLTQPMFGGTVSANSMDDAVSVVLKVNNILVVPVEFISEYGSRCGHEFKARGEKVSIVVWAVPENYVEG